MYCKNCGAVLQPGAYVCTQCGVPVGTGNRFCQNCGGATDEKAVVCVRCGANLYGPQQPPYGQPFVPPGTVQKSKLAAVLLAFFLGVLGVHNFYLGYTGKGVAQLLITLLSCGVFSIVSFIWAVVEAIQLLTDSYPTDADGIPLKD